MSKRFGRTQRRKLRERISTLEGTNALDRHLLEHNGRKLRDIRAMYAELVENVEQAFGQNSVLLPVKLHGSHVAPSNYNVPIHSPIRAWEVDPSSPCAMDMHYLTLERVSAAAEFDVRSMGYHVKLRLPDGKSIYYCTPDVMRMPGIPNEVRRELVSMTVRELDLALSKGQRG